MRVETIVEQQKLDKKLGMKVGDRVRVKESIIVYHNPEHRSEAFDIKGMEGEVLKIVTEWEGRPVSANLPILVKFNKKFKAHLRESELEVIQ
ncbi:ferredoxin-thioredoxin reductase variable chain [Mastigocoleus sp. MO_188.B34]|uniref:ferredoxin-thioredoxin reductase variable chain n=1 Tax=Mastigocoleus sp. MO_188.B34 TaxID=3036635 RepID=UPI00261B7D2E|nr:ferredoxin-thioredoxin reductase variable chain [Mastigocoleus sp. MO_188.B34]MDJ0697955.1 ferredoxin-thioredoxin reductase variable chain [Mastigocoleus sp. MO_188.B34]